jgi:hypothetical protein
VVALFLSREKELMRAKKACPQGPVGTPYEEGVASRLPPDKPEALFGIYYRRAMGKNYHSRRTNLPFQCFCSVVRALLATI